MDSCLCIHRCFIVFIFRPSVSLCCLCSIRCAAFVSGEFLLLLLFKRRGLKHSPSMCVCWLDLATTSQPNCCATATSADTLEFGVRFFFSTFTVSPAFCLIFIYLFFSSLLLLMVVCVIKKNLAKQQRWQTGKRNTNGKQSRDVNVFEEGTICKKIYRLCSQITFAFLLFFLLFFTRIRDKKKHVRRRFHISRTSQSIRMENSESEMDRARY